MIMVIPKPNSMLLYDIFEKRVLLLVGIKSIAFSF